MNICRLGLSQYELWLSSGLETLGQPGRGRLAGRLADWHGVERLGTDADRCAMSWSAAGGRTEAQR